MTKGREGGREFLISSEVRKMLSEWVLEVVWVVKIR